MNENRKKEKKKDREGKKKVYDSVCKYKSRYFYVVTVLPMGENIESL